MNIYDFSGTTIDGRMETLARYRGQVLLIVNVASRCGFTPQYEGLQRLYEHYRGQGFTILGFPCDQFGHQEPGSAAEIKTFCETTYRVTFPLFSKIEVNGPDAHPLYRYLVNEKAGILGTKAIKWNFTKFLVDRQGRPVKRYAPGKKPEAIEKEIAQELKRAQD